MVTRDVRRLFGFLGIVTAPDMLPQQRIADSAEFQFFDLICEILVSILAPIFALPDLTVKQLFALIEITQRSER